jgi:hypothetical protein
VYIYLSRLTGEWLSAEGKKKERTGQDKRLHDGERKTFFAHDAGHFFHVLSARSSHSVTK